MNYPFFYKKESEPSYMTSSTVAYDIEMDVVRSPTLGGATLSLARADYDNVNYKNSKKLLRQS